MLHSPIIKSDFRRDNLTWLAYLFLAYYSFMPTTVGPVMPFLRSELSLTYAMGGLHLTAASLGIVLGGILADRIVRRLGRKKTWWLGACGVAVGILGLALGKHVAITITSVLWMGLSGSLVLVLVQAILSDHHGAWRAVALTEANIGASLSSALAPIIISIFVKLGWSWRSALSLQFLYLALLAVGFFRTQIPEVDTLQDSTQTKKDGKLPRQFWVFWTAILFFVSVEWCLWVWGADFFVSIHGLSKATAALVVSVYLSFGVLGRIAVSRLTRKLPAISLLVIVLGLCCLGFPFFWLAKWIPLALAGYVVAGLGVTNLYPLGMSLAVGSAAQQSDQASARISMGIGLAGLSAPLGLGWLADKMGIQAAFAVVAVLLACVTVLIMWVFWRRDSRIGITSPTD
jgi:fucose permease